MSRYEPRIHIQHPRFTTMALCGLEWSRARGGEPRSDTSPPVVFDPESGSVNAANCATCLLRWRRMRGPKTAAS